MVLMFKQKKLTTACFAAGLALCSLSTQAPATPQLVENQNYLEHPAAKAFIQEVLAENITSQKAVEDLLQSASRQQSILEAIARPAEKTKSWAEYRPIFLTDDRIKRGVEYYRQYESTFVRAEKEYGVSRFIILAIIGVETRYGQFKGRYRVADSLATLAFDYPPRSQFFRSELKHFLHLQQEAGIDLLAAKGSYAGAMGYGQFISSSYRHYAVDFDQDGHRDIIDNPVDAIGSVANYFKQHGWRKEQPVASLARDMNPKPSEKLAALVNADLKPRYTVADFAAAGLIPDANFDAMEAATGWALEGGSGPEYWLGLHNFYVITRYNHSHLYALAVYQLSEELRKRLA